MVSKSFAEMRLQMEPKPIISSTKAHLIPPHLKIVRRKQHGLSRFHSPPAFRLPWRYLRKQHDLSQFHSIMFCKILPSLAFLNQFQYPEKCNIRISTRALKMRMVGLTGGIASGKSTVSNLFKSHGIPVIDADLVARDVLKMDTGGYKKVVAAFGDDILQANGEVDRLKLGRIVFSDASKRQLLNRLLAPYISSGIFYEILKLWLKGCKVIVLDIPLLFEAKMDKWAKPIVVVWVDNETQLQRLMARDGSSEEDARSRINAQMSLDVKRSKADFVIDNTGTLDELEEQFQEVLFQVTRPLTWSEFWLTRQGAITALISIVIAVVVGKNVITKL